MQGSEGAREKGKGGVDMDNLRFVLHKAHGMYTHAERARQLDWLSALPRKTLASSCRLYL